MEEYKQKITELATGGRREGRAGSGTGRKEGRGGREMKTGKRKTEKQDKRTQENGKQKKQKTPKTETKPTERTLRMLLAQDLPGRLPSCTSYRILVGVWMVFSLVLGTVYRGNLTAALTLPKYPKRIETLKELVEGVER